jgi:hypothetical protein
LANLKQFAGCQNSNTQQSSFSLFHNFFSSLITPLPNPEVNPGLKIQALDLNPGLEIMYGPFPLYTPLEHLQQWR